MSILGKMSWLTRQEQTQIKKGLESLSKSVRNSQTISLIATTPTHKASDHSDKTLSPTSQHMKEKVLGLIAKYWKEVNEEDLPRVMKQMKGHFDDIQEKNPISMVIDLTKQPNARVIMVGDTHCDYNSLAALLEKIAMSSYDYYENSYIVFDGDYLDRGYIFFEFFLLLLEIKKLLGDRCILLKGNHDTIVYNKFSRVLEAQVEPHETSDFINNYCWRDTEYLKKLADYFGRLPYYVLIKNKLGIDMIVHGGIPHNNYLNNVHISSSTGELKLDKGVRIDDVLHDFIWSDPSPKDDVRFQLHNSRFEFGRKQFEQFVTANGINRIFRSHEPVENGVRVFYDNRLFTVFSNGGETNPHTGYPDVLNPVFAIIDHSGSVRFESIHLKRVIVKDQNSAYRSYEDLLYMGKDTPREVEALGDLHLNEEFYIINK